MLTLAAFAAGAVACTGGDGAVDTSPGSDAPSDLPTTDANVTIVPGEWIYEYLGVKVTFEWKDGPPMLTVKNASGAEIAAPAIYVVTQDQRRIDGGIDGSIPLPDATTGQYTVTFPGHLQPADVGVIVLMLGDENWGALSPKVLEQG